MIKKEDFSLTNCTRTSLHDKFHSNAKSTALDADDNRDPQNIPKNFCFALAATPSQPSSAESHMRFCRSKCR